MFPTIEKKKVKGWSTEEMKDKAKEMDQCWKKMAERKEVEVLDKYKAERGSPLEWRRVRRSKNTG